MFLEILPFLLAGGSAVVAVASILFASKSTREINKLTKKIVRLQEEEEKLEATRLSLESKHKMQKDEERRKAVEEMREKSAQLAEKIVAEYEVCGSIAFEKPTLITLHGKVRDGVDCEETADDFKILVEIEKVKVLKDIAEQLRKR